MTDITMAGKKTQSDEPPTLQARLMRLLSDADKDPQLKEGADRALAIAEETYGKNFAAVIQMLGAIDTRSIHTQEHMEGIRHQQAQLIGNLPIISDHLKRQDDKLAALAKMPERVEDAIGGLSALASEFHTTSEALTEWRHDMDVWRTAVDQELASFRQSRDQSIADRRQLQEQYEESRQDRADLRTQGEATRGAVDALAIRLDTFIERINALIDQGLPPDLAVSALAFLNELRAERNLPPLKRDGGG